MQVLAAAARNALDSRVSTFHNPCESYSQEFYLDQEVIGLAEVAQMAGVTPAAVGNWRTRFEDFPEPVAALRAGPVFEIDRIRRWLRKHRGVRMAHVVSFINLKGGVGKTTTCVGVAEMLASSWAHKQKVLVIDLDPQTNATTMLVGEERWEEANKAGHTLATLFADALEEDPAKRQFDLDSTIIRDASGVTDTYGDRPGRVDLLPASLDMIDLQDRLASMNSGRFYSNVPTDILRRAIRARLDEYDWVLIDCPPNLGIITLNGLRISDGFVIPTIPDMLSTYGIPQILTRAEAFAENIDEPIEPIGIIISKYREQSSLHQETVERLRSNKRVHVFKTKIPERNTTASAAEHSSQQTFRQRYGYDGNYDTFQSITRELRELVGDREPAAA
jgi:chromosome partitioning protein